MADSLLCPGVDGLSHSSPALPTDDNFDSLFQQSTRFIFSSEENGGQMSTAEDPAFSGYRVCLFVKEVIFRFIIMEYFKISAVRVPSDGVYSHSAEECGVGRTSMLLNFYSQEKIKEQ